MRSDLNTARDHVPFPTGSLLWHSRRWPFLRNAYEGGVSRGRDRGVSHHSG